jgi:hypothetical protein
MSKAAPVRPSEAKLQRKEKSMVAISSGPPISKSNLLNLQLNIQSYKRPLTPQQLAGTWLSGDISWIVDPSYYNYTACECLAVSWPLLRPLGLIHWACQVGLAGHKQRSACCEPAASGTLDTRCT